MDNFGFIHEELDIKLLILFVLKRLSGPIDSTALADLCRFDSGVGYFDYAECLSQLAESGSVETDEDGYYKITAQGVENADALEDSLPYSVRNKALDLIIPVNAQLKRAALIHAVRENDDSGCYAHLSLSDGKGDILELRVLCTDEQMSASICQKFRHNAEATYSRIISLLSEK